MKISAVFFSILALTTTTASAEVTLSGDARMGVTNAFQHVRGSADPINFSTRARIAFTMSGETDGGLAFGAALRADNAAGAAAGTEGAVFISGGFGKLSVGDVDGAAQAAVGQVDGVGFAGLGSAEELIYFGTGGTGITGVTPGAAPQVAIGKDPSALYEYSVGRLSFFASATDPGGTFTIPDVFPRPDFVYETNASSVGMSYTFDTAKLSIGYEDAAFSQIIPAGPPNGSTIRNIVVGSDVRLGQITLKARYAKAKITDTRFRATFKQSAVSATYNIDALSVTGFTANNNFSLISGALIASLSTYGLGASYDLGGGATLAGGVAKQFRSFGGVKSKDTAFDFGVRLTF